MEYQGFIVRPLLRSEIDHFIDANIQARFLSCNLQDIACFKQAIAVAKHIAILEIANSIKGGIMLFQRWHNAMWATNIFVDPAIQSQGASTALYKYALDYCANRVPWGFCNPIDRITSLHARWGIVSINSWESLSLVTAYNYFFKTDAIDIAFPFRTTFEGGVLQAENKDMVIKISIDQQCLQVCYKHTMQKKQITLPDAYRLRLHTAPAYVKLAQGWAFDPKTGLIIHEKKKITIYAPTASSQSLLGLTIPIDDIKKPIYWDHTHNGLEVRYTTLAKDIHVALLVTFNEQGLSLAISVPENYTPRLTIAHDATSMIRFMDCPEATIERVRYAHCTHIMYHGRTHKFVAHLIDTAPLHRKFLRTFIPKSHRPYTGGTNPYGTAAALPLAAMLLDPTQRTRLMHRSDDLLELSAQGNQILRQIKTKLYATES
ncbi:GNAT family N-acetyltransferase [Cardinium endosymbiont of Philonthus spinipes]|uniref:GNAT family N-acetyltransferase n=1 Tax=Cardinium endosymbiont of Philonthus spinipes TaxID=3077941 RepID=UPI00313AB665